ncbi:MAG: IS1595 family transposase [Candidatus Saccharimonadales bacterium]
MTSLTNIPTEARCKSSVLKLLTGSGKCTKCQSKVSFKREYGWCSNCRVKIRPKATTWFRGSKLTYRQLFVLLWCWQHRQSPGTARLVAGISYTTVARWYWRFRALVPQDDTSKLLDGIVEADEAYFGKRRYGNQTIVMGAIERDTAKLKLAVIPDTEQDSLEGFLETHVARQSLVVTDYHMSYNDLEFLGYSHERFNHSKGHFAGTNHIESNWSAMKRYLRKLYGCVPTKRLKLILREWMARHNQPELFNSPTNFLQETLFRIS